MCIHMRLMIMAVHLWLAYTSNLPNLTLLTTSNARGIQPENPLRDHKQDRCLGVLSFRYIDKHLVAMARRTLLIQCQP